MMDWIYPGCLLGSRLVAGQMAPFTERKDFQRKLGLGEGDHEFGFGQIELQRPLRTAERRCRRRTVGPVREVRGGTRAGNICVRSSACGWPLKTWDGGGVEKEAERHKHGGQRLRRRAGICVAEGTSKRKTEALLLLD